MSVCSVSSKAVSHEYEEYVLNVGDFDERIFLGADDMVEIGTPAKTGPAVVGDLMEKMQVCHCSRMFLKT